MPALTAIRTPAISALAGELSFASKPTLLRHLSRIEQLAPLIEADGVYPEDFIVFRVTNYRPDIAEPALIQGADLLADLSALAEHLSQSARLSPDDLPDDHFTIDSLAAYWNVSRKTIERYRRLGLVARRIDKGSGHRTIAFLPGPVSWFEDRFGDRLNDAASFSRIDPSVSIKIIRDARRYRARLGLSRTNTSKRIAQRIGRSTESVRRTLIAFDESCPETGDTPIYSMSLPADQEQQLEMLRQSLQGKRTGTIAARVGRSPTSVNRSINRARHALILNASLQSAHTEDKSNTEVQPDSTILHDPIVTTGLSTRGPTNLIDLLEHLRQPHPPIIHEQTTRARAIAVLEQRAAQLTSTLSKSTPSGKTLDQIETLMRWIVLLRIELVSTQLPLMLSTIEQHIAGPIDTLDPTRACDILQDAIATVDAAITAFIHKHPPTSTSRLAAPVGLAITRWASRLPDIAIPPEEGKAARRIVHNHQIQDWTVPLWLHWWWIKPPALLSAYNPVLPNEQHQPEPTSPLSDRDREILTRRYALDGAPPQTLDDLALWLNTPALHAGRMSQAALKRAQPKGATPLLASSTNESTSGPLTEPPSGSG